MKSVDNIRWRNHLIPLLVPLLLLLGWQLSVSCGWLSTRIRIGSKSL
jgi:ABC-type nitrate/sulfonate/bicarbonate transport system permease component